MEPDIYPLGVYVLTWQLGRVILVPLGARNKACQGEVLATTRPLFPSCHGVFARKCLLTLS